MDEKHEDKRHYRKGIGADLILPLMAAAYAVYYLYTVADFPWEAQMMGTFIAIAIWLLVGLMVVRTALKVWRGDATLRATGLTRPQSKLLLRSAFIGLTALSILLMPWLGFTLAVMLFLLSGMLLLGVRKVKPLVIIPLAAGSVGYLLFIAALDTRLPYGPVEMLLQWLV
ncbi:MAG TPA: tripartite tricarboxylate transporter TctB family protein [Kiloniellaceae bacterium]